jgi:quinol monooxygenase YgiN
MYILTVTLKIKAEHREAFVEAMLGDATGSVRDEPGCLRFDVIQDEEDPNTLYLHEVYRDKTAFEAHLEAPHFLKWRETVKDWFASPPQSGKGVNIFPADKDWDRDWKA